MNVVLFEPAELSSDGTVRMTGRRAAHVRQVLRAGPGDHLLVGAVGGRLGQAEVVAQGEDGLVLVPTLDREPPPPSPVSLLLALPRPKILRRVLQAATAMGVKRIALVGSFRVEKSFFASPFLAPEALRAELLLGLEQGRDTVVPEVTLHRFFKPFLEDVLDVAFPEPVRLLAHTVDAAPIEDCVAGVRGAVPGARATAPGGPRAVVAIGPEGGWTAYEAERLRGKGFLPVSLGPRPLRVDAAVPCAVGQVELWLRTFGFTLR